MASMKVKQADGSVVSIPLGLGDANDVVALHNSNLTAHTDIREKISQLSSEKVDKSNITLGLHTDGLFYIFVDGTPVGNGIALPSGSAGDVVGNVDSANNIILTGNLTEDNYSVKYEMADGTIVDIGDLVLSKPEVIVNLLDTAYDTDLATVYDGVGWKANMKMRSSGAIESGGLKNILTGLIPIGDSSDVFHIHGVTKVHWVSGEDSGFYGTYDASGVWLNSRKSIANDTSGCAKWGTDENGDFTIAVSELTVPSGAKYVRFQFGEPTGTVIVTRNQLITV